MNPALRVLQPGMLTTIQDLGRQRTQQIGVPIGGAMDRFALLAANRLVNNDAGLAGLEITGGEASFELLTPLLLAVTGAYFNVKLDGLALPTWTTMFAGTGQELRIECGQTTSRCYLAIRGGIAVPEVLGSRSTNLASRFGGLEGRQLRAGDTLAHTVSTFDVLRCAGRAWPVMAQPPYSANPTLRIIRGPHLDLFSDTSLTALLATQWHIGLQSNRIGYRLEGNSLLNNQTVSIPSHGVIPGAIQVPADGKPILLMADAQTTGGYPIIAVVIAADLPLAAQLLPGAQLSFAQSTIDEAVEARQIMDTWQRIPLVEDEILTQLDWA